MGPFLHIYFDLFAGSLQALVFGILTITYWKLQMNNESNRNELMVKLPRKLRKKQKELTHEEQRHHE